MGNQTSPSENCRYDETLPKGYRISIYKPTRPSGTQFPCENLQFGRAGSPEGRSSLAWWGSNVRHCLQWKIFMSLFPGYYVPRRGRQPWTAEGQSAVCLICSSDCVLARLLVTAKRGFFYTGYRCSALMLQLVTVWLICYNYHLYLFWHP